MTCITEAGLVSEPLVGIPHPKCQLIYKNKKSDEHSSMICLPFPRLDEGNGRQPFLSEGWFLKRAVVGGQTRAVFPFCFLILECGFANPPRGHTALLPK